MTRPCILAEDAQPPLRQLWEYRHSFVQRIVEKKRVSTKKLTPKDDVLLNFWVWAVQSKQVLQIWKNAEKWGLIYTNRSRHSRERALESFSETKG